jgi:hypothetical protein
MKPTVNIHDAIARAKTALRSAERGIGVMTSEDFLDCMQKRAKAAQGRIRAAVADRNKRSKG